MRDDEPIDDEPIDGDWLVSIGGVRHTTVDSRGKEQTLTVGLGISGAHLTYVPHGAGYLRIDAVLPVNKITRGQLRRMLRDLGIETEEPTNA